MNEALIRKFNERLKAGKAVFGPFMKTCDPGFVEAAGYAGMESDWHEVRDFDRNVRGRKKYGN